MVKPPKGDGTAAPDQSTAQAVAVPASFVVVSPNGQQACSGVYILVDPCGANGQPLWRKCGGEEERWLYSGVNGRWFIGGPEERQKNFACSSGRITSVAKHGGDMPDTASWTRLMPDKVSWTMDADITISTQVLAKKTVAVYQLLAFVKKHEKQIEQSTTVEEAVKQIMKPATLSDKCCYSDYMLGAKKPADIMVRCDWKSSFRDLFLCIMQHAIGSLLTWKELDDKVFSGKLSRDTLDRVYWIDVFAMNYHEPPVDSVSQANMIEDVMDSMNVLIVALDPELRTLKNSSLLLDIGAAAERGMQVEFCGWLAESSKGTLTEVESLMQSDIPSSEREALRARIEAKKGGVEAFDQRVKGEVMSGVKNLALKQAMRNMEQSAVESLLNVKADPNVLVSRQRETALMWAVQYGPLEEVLSLLAAGADPNIRCIGGWTALFFAVQLGSVGTVQALLSAGGDVGLVGPGGVTVLREVKERGHGREVTEALLELLSKSAEQVS
jgi:ankyrin repeat protein